MNVFFFFFFLFFSLHYVKLLFVFKILNSVWFVFLGVTPLVF
uniref:Uncharacterized protein n=1 Tax=Anguilla anguilla TaxID=7936 RepID=A0A0E9VTS4_ANGAN